MRNITNIEIWNDGPAGNQHPLEYCFLGIAGVAIILPSTVRFAVVVSSYKTDVDFLMVAQRREDNIEIRGVGAFSMS